MSAAFINSLNNDDTLITEIKSASNILKSCDPKQPTEAEEIHEILESLTICYSSNQNRYVNNIISCIFDLNIQNITEWKIAMLDTILDNIKANKNIYTSRIMFIMIDKIILYKDLLSNKSSDLNSWISDNFFPVIMAEKDFNNYYVNSANGNSNLLNPKNSNRSKNLKLM